jgi:phosphatidate cytidylyltransferase
MSKNLLLRVMSSMILVPSFIIAIVWFKWVYLILLFCVACCMLVEWFNITKNTIYAKYGPLIVFLPIICLMFLRLRTQSYEISLLYFISIWTVDTFAMIGGKLIGGFKLAPIISPNKTWSGLICACIASGFMCHIFATFFEVQELVVSSLFYGILNALISQSSDIFISYFKRKCNVKESGTLLPGHGGFLDRFDSIIFSAPLLLLLVSI